MLSDTVTSLVEKIFAVQLLNLIENVETSANKNTESNTNNVDLKISVTSCCIDNPSSGSSIFITNLNNANKPNKVIAIAIIPL